MENCLSLMNIICFQSIVIPHTMPSGTVNETGTVGLGIFSKLCEVEYLSVLCCNQAYSKLGGTIHLIIWDAVHLGESDSSD